MIGLETDIRRGEHDVATGGAGRPDKGVAHVVMLGTLARKV
jgi:hypothetical protein